jgi:hypothetical protein
MPLKGSLENFNPFMETMFEFSATLDEASSLTLVLARAKGGSDSLSMIKLRVSFGQSASTGEKGIEYKKQLKIATALSTSRPTKMGTYPENEDSLCKDIAAEAKAFSCRASSE